MINETLTENPEEIRATAAAVQTLAEDFDGLRIELQRAIGEELNTACAGDVADYFTKYYNDNIDTKLVAEKERLDGVVLNLNNTATEFETTADEVKAAF